MQYEIVVNGHLSSRWAAWFDGFTITCEPDGTSVLRGVVADQAALHGLLEKLRDLGIPLLALVQLPSSPATEPSVQPTQGDTP